MRVMGVKGLTLYHLKSHLQVCVQYIYRSMSIYGFLVALASMVRTRVSLCSLSLSLSCFVDCCFSEIQTSVSLDLSHVL